MAKNSAINISSASSVIVTDENGVLVPTSSMTDGQIVIGSTGAAPVAASLTAGSGISITPGAGALTIAATGGGGGTSGGLINVQYLKTSGTYTATPGTVSCLVMAVGGGGGGGAIPSKSTGAQSTAASGGSGGAFGQKYYSIAPTGTAYVIGSGGVGGLAGSNSGSTGGATTFNNGDMNLLGGGGGHFGVWGFWNASNSVPTIFPAFSGGIPDPTDNSDFTSNGGIGAFGISSVYVNLSANCHGGDSILGKGAGCIPYSTTVNGGTAAGSNATGYGGGGSGAGGSNNGAISLAGQPGGNGAPGIIIVYEYS